MSVSQTLQSEPPPGNAPGRRFVTAIRKVNRLLSLVSISLSALLCLGLMVIVGYSVIMRYFVNQPQTWTDEMAGYLMVGIVMFGLADTTRRGGHIGVDLVMQFLGSRGQRLIDIWGTVCMIIISGAILYSSYGMVAFSYSVDLLSEGYVEVPMWIPQSAVPLGMVLMLIASFSRLLDILFGDKPVPRGH